MMRVACGEALNLACASGDYQRVADMAADSGTGGEFCE
jgi:hypothetical protein